MRHLGGTWEASGRHLGGIWVASGRLWEASGRPLVGTRRHLERPGGTQGHLEASGWSGLQKVEHLSAKIDFWTKHINFTVCF